MHCQQCGVEANGLQAINRVFGYKIVNDDITPYSICRECRKKQNHRRRKKKNGQQLPVGEEKLISQGRNLITTWLTWDI